MSSSPQLKIPQKEIDVVEPGQRARKGRIAFDLRRDLTYSTTALESFAFARWEPVISDAMVVAAAVEFADKVVKRPPRGWARRISLRVPVHSPERWTKHDLSAALHDALEFLTGDYWSLTFTKRRSEPPAPPQNFLNLGVKTEAVLAYSDGMDSRAVAGIIGADLGDKLVRVRVGSKTCDRPTDHEPFTSVPYAVQSDMSNRETSARTRGFKFALISGIAAYLTDAEKIIIPESGQGAIGPVLVTVGHAYPDYRNHPLFTKRMERFLMALLGKQVSYVFPRLWNTKGETLAEFAATSKGNDWQSTKSCWRNNQWSSVNGRWRQCGVCAACMLRRVSVHATGLAEEPETYVCTDMSAETLEEAVDPDFTKLGSAYREYAIAGVMHMDHLADMASEDAKPLISRHASLLGPALGLSPEETEKHLAILLNRHAKEWKNFMNSLGINSYVWHWARCGQ